MNSDAESSHKVVMLGSSSVGKTSIVLQLHEKVFKRMVTPTVGSGVIMEEISTHKGIVQLRIWDTAGEERYRTFTGLYSRSASAGIIVFDITEPSSFESLNSWIREFKNNALENAPLYLVGNKIDLVDQRMVSNEEAKNFAIQNGLKYFEVSAKTGENVELLFTDLATELGPKIMPIDELAPVISTPRDSGCNC
ncbi:small GTP-binding protein [Histomonas meleagridis]|uniref:small GTP-binding protein n=1 Tax=Histomonas meleagridis TaxID=135588 RepID=UPI00355A7650|nr:small GTP-binding protein [Histomonas meleagridis]KAH0798508.1 small GTP-binding protein [Histomonas meleagridis]